MKRVEQLFSDQEVLCEYKIRTAVDVRQGVTSNTAVSIYIGLHIQLFMIPGMIPNTTT